MKKTTAEWVRKAEADRVAAQKCSRSASPLHDVVCFHCQQCAEKYLKALLEELGLSIPKTHHLEDLLTFLLPKHGVLRSLRRGLLFLTNFAVDTRYPGNNASKRQLRPPSVGTTEYGWLHAISWAFAPSDGGERNRHE